MSGHIEKRIRELGFELPTAPEAVGFYVPVLRVSNFVLTSGQLPFVGTEIAFQGRIGEELSEQEGTEAARICALNGLAQIKSCIGDLDKVRQVVRVDGYVHSRPGFHNQPQVVNGASRLLVDVFGEIGRHTRIALGVNDMPLNAAAQVAIWVEVEA